MTNLAAPPIAVGVKHPYWRYKDTSGPPVASQYVAVFVDVTVPEGTTPYVNHIYGSGKTGKRLWVYSPGYQWIPVPVGSGEDTALASFNVRNKKTGQWMTPTWFADQVGDTKNGFLTRVKNGQIYDDRSNLNTNYDQYNDEFLPTPDGYLRLVWMEPRRDPTWRILSILETYPNHPPSTKVGPYDYRGFEPRGGRLSYTTQITFNGSVSLSSYAQPYATLGPGTPYASDGQDNNLLTSSEFSRYQSPAANGGTFPPGNFTHTADTENSGMLDLAAMKAQLIAVYPNRDLSFCGQYDHIVLHHVQRMYLFGYVDFFIEYGSDDLSFPDVVDCTSQMQTINFTVYSTTNYPGVVFPDNYSVYNPRYPQDVTPSGTIIVEQTGLPGGSQVIHQPGSAPFMRMSFRRFVQYNMLAPGEDNIRFSANILNVPEPGFTTAPRIVNGITTTGTYPGYVRASAQFIAQGISIHYTEPGVDTPASTHYDDFGLGAFTAT